MDVGEDTAGGDGHTSEELVELLVVADGELHVAGDNAALLVVASGVAGQFEDLSGEVLHHGSKVDRGSSADASGILAGLEVTVHTADGELETSLLGAGHGLAALGLAATGSTLSSLSGHDVSLT